MNSKIPEISSLTRSDTTVVSTLAGKIWRHQYAEIISPDQIDYMLAQRYCPLLIKSQVSSDVVWWQKMTLNEAIIGFSCYMRTDASDTLKIDKLYIDIDHQHKGYGALFIADAVETMHKNSCNSLILTVNKQNSTAIAAYKKYGFEIIGDSIVDIGGGYFMNDHLMSMTKLCK